MKTKFVTILIIISITISFSVPLKTLAAGATWSVTVKPLSLTKVGSVTGGGCLPSTNTFDFAGVATTAFKLDPFYSEIWRGKDNPKCFTARPTSNLLDLATLTYAYELGKNEGGNWSHLLAGQTVDGPFAVYDKEYKYYELKLTMPQAGFVAQIRLPQYGNGVNDYGPVLAEGTSNDNTVLNLTASNTYIAGTSSNNPAPVTSQYTGKLAVFIRSTSPMKKTDGSSSYWWYYKELDQSEFTNGNPVTQAGTGLALNVTHDTAAYTKEFKEADFNTTDPVPTGLADASLFTQITGLSGGGQCGDAKNIGDAILVGMCNITVMVRDWALGLMCFAQDKLVEVLIDTPMGPKQGCGSNGVLKSYQSDQNMGVLNDKTTNTTPVTAPTNVSGSSH